jgi:hypothetical protein
MGVLWKLIDGKKTAFAAVFWGIRDLILPIWFPDGLTGMPNKITLTIGAALTIIGLGHKWYKKNHEGE